MSEYSPPLQDMMFALYVAGIDEVLSLPGCGEVTKDLADTILDEASRLARDKLSPLRRAGDIEGCQWTPEGVRTPSGWSDAWAALREGGWVGLGGDQRYGGQGLPRILSAPVDEIWLGSNVAFAMLKVLATGSAEALLIGGSDDLKRRFVPKLLEGSWSGTMNLTEPASGSDLSLLKTRAIPADDGTYKIIGQKIFISYGDHQMTENIIHLVLARLPDAPPGVKGISLFVVPKFMVDDNGRLAQKNDVKCISLEHKMGLRGSPTCVMAYGEEGGATGYLVGEPNRGLEYMFVMMNEARFHVGLQAVAQGDAAYQHALRYAHERRQGRDAVTGDSNVPIIRHPDVKRMLLRMEAQTQASRLLCYWVAAEFDHADKGLDDNRLVEARANVDLLIPIVKGWCSEIACEVASLGMQVHGGMGYIEETGAAQYLRDARITPIYEGTTGIQANDLLVRKVLRDRGEALRGLLAIMQSTAAELRQCAEHEIAANEFADALSAYAHLVDTSTGRLLEMAQKDMAGALAVAVPFLHLVGTVVGAWQWARALLYIYRSGELASDHCQHQALLAKFYLVHVLPAALGHAETVCMGSRHQGGGLQ